MAKPLTTIKNFSGMGDNGSYYLEGMSPYKLNGQTILTPSWYCSDFISEDTAGYSAMGIINGFTNIPLGTSDALKYRFFGIGTEQIFDFSSTIAATGKGLIHDSTETATSKPDIITTTNNNVLYSQSRYLGIGRIFTATGGSTTTIVVSSEDFNTNYDYAGGDRLYNFTKGEEYTIDTGGVGSTTLTLVTGTACAADDIFMVFNDNFQDLGTGADFVGQISNITWVKQIKLLGDEYWILNGNYIASLNIDESTFSATAKQLPYNTQAVCFDTNQDKILVGGDQSGQGILTLWDTYSDGWLSILKIEGAPDAIRSYGNGWVVSIQGNLYFTNGYQIELLTTYPDLEDYRQLQNVHYNGIQVISNDIVMSVDPGGSNRAKTGLAIYNVKTGWSFSPFSNGSGLLSYNSTEAGALHRANVSNLPALFVYGEIGAGTKSRLLNKIYKAGEGVRTVASTYTRLPEKMKINTIELNLSPKYSGYIESSGTVKVTVSYGDGRDEMQKYTTAGTSNTTTTLKNSLGATWSATVGDEILILDGDTAGERSWVTSIASGGTNSEVLTVSPAFTAGATDSSKFNIMKLNLAEQKTIETDLIPDNLTFNVSNFYSDKLFVQVILETLTGTTVLDIHSININ